MEKKREDYLKEAGTKPGNYESKYDPQIEQMAQDLVDRKPFTYDFNADPLYQQYRDQYTQAGQQAMLDTMGNAASLSGGYGNSYAATAGNQAYGQYMTQLNNVIPQLYDAAYNRYTNEENTLRNNLAMLQGLDDTAYGRWMDQNNLYWQGMNFYNSNFENDRSYQLSQDQFDHTKDMDTKNYNLDVDRLNHDIDMDNKNYTLESNKLTYEKERDALNRQDAQAAATAQAQAQIEQDRKDTWDWSVDFLKGVEERGASKEDLATTIEGLGLDEEMTTLLLEQFTAYDAWYDIYGKGEDSKKKNKVKPDKKESDDNAVNSTTATTEKQNTSKGTAVVGTTTTGTTATGTITTGTTAKKRK